MIIKSNGKVDLFLNKKRMFIINEFIKKTPLMFRLKIKIIYFLNNLMNKHKFFLKNISVKDAMFMMMKLREKIVFNRLTFEEESLSK